MGNSVCVVRGRKALGIAFDFTSNGTVLGPLPNKKSIPDPVVV